MRQRRGQAAMEFLMTYGWALLVVLIAIGALAFFGVLNPGRFLPETCNVSPGFGCVDSRVTTTQATVIMQNGLGTNIEASSSLTVDATSLHGSACLATVTNAGTLLDGKSATYTITLPGGCTGISAGSKFKSDLVFRYTPSGGSPHSKVGQLISKIEA